ncbi:MAG: hypothetical protein ABL962_19765 [Fimbriimonadaceae bacterium]
MSDDLLHIAQTTAVLVRPDGMASSDVNGGFFYKDIEKKDRDSSSWSVRFEGGMVGIPGLTYDLAIEIVQRWNAYSITRGTNSGSLMMNFTSILLKTWLKLPSQKAA